MWKYSVRLYEKDSDVYDVFMTMEDYEMALRVSESLSVLVKNDLVLRQKSDGTREPYDDVVIMGAAGELKWSLSGSEGM